MKVQKIVRLLCLISFIITFGRFTVAQPAKLHQINLAENDSGKKVSILKGRTFALRLPNRVDGGYRFDKEQFDSTIIRLIKHIKLSPTANSRLGAPGKDVWQFMALKKGSTSLKITASRPWTKAGTLVVFTNEVEVK